MADFAKKLLAVLNYPRTFPVYLCALCSPQKHLIKKDIARWNEIHGIRMGLFKSINYYMTFKKEFRNLLLHRFRHPSPSFFSFIIARMLWKPLDSLCLYTQDIGGGLYIQHGFATLVGAKRIGENCRIYQQVSIGFKGDESPVLEDNVSVACGAIVLGGITMHSHSLAAAGAVVLKDVPEKAIVAGVPAKIIGYKDENNLDFQG